MSSSNSGRSDMAAGVAHALLRNRLFGVTAALAVAALSMADGGKSLISSSNTGADIWHGLNIADVIKAKALYAAGITGSHAILANVESGYVWNAHDTTIGKSITYFKFTGAYNTNKPAGWGGNLGDFDEHATAVGHTLFGNGDTGTDYYHSGIAYGADPWSGSIASYYGNGNGSFGWTDYALPIYGYKTALVDGINGHTADVINSSWGGTNRTGTDGLTMSIDGWIRQSHKVACFSAGNSGPANNSIGNPASGYNSICVGATGVSASNSTVHGDQQTPPFSSVAYFSSRGPQNYQGSDGNAARVRARVDVLAPGDSLTLAYYGGKTGTNWNGTDPTGGSGSYYGYNWAGTSFSSPIVAGSASLLVDAAKIKGLTNGVDARVVKALILAGADHLTGWTNNATTVSGVYGTTQALDYNQGAGQIDVQNSYDTLAKTASTRDVAGLAGGSIKVRGWDFGEISTNAVNDYVMSERALGGSKIMIALNWFIDNEYSSNTATTITGSYVDFTKLSLQLYSYAGGGAGSLLAQSTAQYINSQYVYFTLPTTDKYVIRVAWNGKRYGSASSVDYGMAWRTTAVPEPTTLLGFGALAVGAFIRRRSKKA